MRRPLRVSVSRQRRCNPFTLQRGTWIDGRTGEYGRSLHIFWRHRLIDVDYAIRASGYSGE